MTNKSKNKIIFLNTGWMKFYKGINKGIPIKEDFIFNGGEYIKEHTGEAGHEEYNFQPFNKKYYCCAPAGNESINIDRLGANPEDDSVGNITVIITATPEGGGRSIVGWYDDATVFRKRQSHPEIKGYDYVALSKTAICLPKSERKFTIDTAFHKSFYGGDDNKLISDVLRYVKTRKIPNSYKTHHTLKSGNSKKSSQHSGSSATTDIEHVRMYFAHEKKILPLHNKLQKAFLNFLTENSIDIIEEDQNCIDLRYIDSKEQIVLTEVKPVTEKKDVKLAVRFAIGQLLDYNYTYEQNRKKRLIIVIGCEPEPEIIKFVHTLDMEIAWTTDSGWQKDGYVEFNFSKKI